MIILDTNIISEVMRPQPEQNVIQWLNKQRSNDLYISSISIAEINYGLYVLPQGRRKQQLKSRFNQFINKAFLYQTLDFDEQAAILYGQVMGEGKLIGHPMSVLGGQIAAIALHNGFAVASRNVKDFKYCGVEIINPFIA